MKFRFTKAKTKPVIKTYIEKSGSSKSVLDRLNDFLDESAPQAAFFLNRMYSEQQNAVAYRELREAVLNGYMNETVFKQWQEDYSRFVVQHLQPLWISSMQSGAQNCGFKNIFNYAEKGVMNWIKTNGARFVTNQSEESRNAIQAMLSCAISEKYTVDELARLIRPVIGLTKQQAEANAKYYDAVKNNLTRNHPRLTPATVEKRARDAAMRYAEKQHRYRADTIAQTELAFAYNRGMDEAVKQAMAKGLMGRMARKWVTADDDACELCKALAEESENSPIDMEDEFSAPWKEDSFGNMKQMKWPSLFAGAHETPPAHPRCRCAVEYIEVEASGFLRNGEMISFDTDFMADGESSVDWSEAKPQTHTKEDEEKIISYANERNVMLGGLKHFDGDIKLLAEQIDAARKTLDSFGMTQTIRIETGLMPDGDFGSTRNNTITLNTKALRNKKITEKILNEDNYLAATNIKGIAVHECGHIITHKIGQKGIDIVQKAYYNLYKEELSFDEILVFLNKYISEYSASFWGFDDRKRGDKKKYIEVIPEILSKHITNQDEFTAEVVRLLKELM